MAIIGSVLGGGKAGVKEQTYNLRLRLDGLSDVISEYQPYVKSSDLRSSSASLSGIISNTSRDLEKYIEDTYGSEKPKEKAEKEEEERSEALKNDLFEAKINGILDRIYAHKMDYEISLLLQMENKLYNAVSNETLKDIVGTSYNSLGNIQEKFSGFSEAQ